MPDFLKTTFDGGSTNWADISIRLAVAVVLGAGVAGVYRVTRKASDVAPTFPVTLVLLSALIAMSTQVIGDNIARAFSLVGALSIVRFRTVVRDTQDTAYVIFAVVVGMAVGAHNLTVALIGIVIVGIAALLMRPRGGRPAMAPAPPFVLHLRVGLGHDIEALVGSTLDTHMADRQIMSMSTAKQGLVVDVSYQGTLRQSGPEALLKALNRVEGVQGVELVRQTEHDS